MVVKQISIFVENKEGRIKKAMNTLAEANINIRALSIADTTKYGILRLIVSDNEKAIAALEKDGFIVKENEVLLLSIPDKPNGLNTVLTVFDEKGINLDYVYAFVSSKPNVAILVIRLENMERAKELIDDEDIKLLKKDDIKFIEEIHGLF
ncbi:amino acid-binding protein [Methanobrevibacter sp.]|uniref:amino acid-binding protein n=1 Tax=Methanobrevibacter sp. TaxID=66852 RepID=UPI003D7C8C8D